jgi:hypothetical protein
MKKIKNIHCFHLELNIDGSKNRMLSLVSNGLGKIGYSVIRSQPKKDAENLRGIIKIDLEGQYLDQVARSLSH